MYPVTDAHFGTNLLFDSVYVNPNGQEHFHDLEDGSPMIEILEKLGTKYIRYPGGTVTERGAQLNPRIFFERNGIGIPYSEAIAYCVKYGKKMHFVVPTLTFVDQPDNSINGFLNSLKQAEGWQNVIATFEIGNEYWDIGQSPEDYGKIAARVFDAIDRFKKRESIYTPVYIQHKPDWCAGHHHDLVGGFGYTRYSKIDGLVDHWYPTEFPKASADHPRLRPEQVSWPLSLWTGNTSNYHISEWNLNMTHTTKVGVAHGFQLVNMFWAMVNAGVKFSTIWGVNYRNLSVKLTGVRWDKSSYKNASGTIYSTLSDTIGYTPINGAEPHRAIFGRGKNRIVYLYNADANPIQDLTYVDYTSAATVTRFDPVDDTSTNWVDESLLTQDQMVEKKITNLQGNRFVGEKGQMYMFKYRLK